MSVNPFRLLISFPYWSEEFAAGLSNAGPEVEWVLDSGAFSAFRAGKTIALVDYCDFLERLPVQPYRYFALDVIGDAVATRANYEAMLERGLSPIPIFTRGESQESLERYYETSDTVAIGGLVKTYGNFGFVRGVMELVGERRVHWLGFNRANFIAYYKPAMVDCSSWSYGFRFGDAYVYLGAGRWKHVYRRTLAARPTGVVKEILDFYEVDATKLAMSDQWKQGGVDGVATEVETLCCRSWARYQDEVYEQFETRFYLAMTGSWWHPSLMFEARQWWAGKKARRAKGAA